MASLSSRRAWIEMWMNGGGLKQKASRSPHGERGLKYGRICGGGAAWRRSPHGERGLKWCFRAYGRDEKMVALLTESVD